MSNPNDMSVQIITNAIFLLLGAGVSFFLMLIATRPKLIISGGGGGGTSDPEGLCNCSITFRNDPSFTFLGIRMPRETVKTDFVILRDPKSKKHFNLDCNWQEPITGKNIKETSIEAGEQRALMAFSYDNDRPVKQYYVYKDNIRTRAQTQQQLKFEENEKELKLTITDKLGRAYNFKIKVLIGQTNLNVYYTKTLQDRFENICDGARTIWHALFSKY